MLVKHFEVYDFHWEDQGIHFLNSHWVLTLIFLFLHVPHGAGPGAEGGGVPAQEEGEDDISGTQFVCETVIRSMTLEEAPDHAPLRGSRTGKGESATCESLTGLNSVFLYRLLSTFFSFLSSKIFYQKEESVNVSQFA